MLVSTLLLSAVAVSASPALVARQNPFGGAIPAECQSACQPLSDQVSKCGAGGDFSACSSMVCSPEYTSNVKACAECIIGGAGDPTGAIAQALQSVTAGCSNGGANANGAADADSSASTTPDASAPSGNSANGPTADPAADTTAPTNAGAASPSATGIEKGTSGTTGANAGGATGTATGTVKPATGAATGTAGAASGTQSGVAATTPKNAGTKTAASVFGVAALAAVAALF